MHVGERANTRIRDPGPNFLYCQKILLVPWWLPCNIFAVDFGLPDFARSPLIFLSRTSHAAHAQVLLQFRAPSGHDTSSAHQVRFFVGVFCYWHGAWACSLVSSRPSRESPPASAPGQADDHRKVISIIAQELVLTPTPRLEKAAQ